MPLELPEDDPVVNTFQSYSMNSELSQIPQEDMEYPSMFGLNAFGVPRQEVREDPHKDDPAWNQLFVVSGQQLKGLRQRCGTCRTEMHRRIHVRGTAPIINYT